MKRKLTPAFLSVFCMEMAVLFHAGIPLTDGVRALLADADKNRRIVLESLLGELVKKAPLSSALSNSGYFPAHMVGVVAAGEKTGRTVEMLKSLEKYYDRLDRLAVTIKNAVFFPLVLLAIMVGVVIILITRVLPIFNDVYGRHGSRMPPVATSFMRFGQWLAGASAIIAALLFVIFIIVLLIWLFPPIRNRALSAVKNRSAGRGIFGELASYHFISMMTLSVESGVKSKEAVELASAVSGGISAVDKKNAACARLLLDGADLAKAMGEAGILTAGEAQMLGFGIQGGMTDSMLAEIANRKERYLLDKINRIVGRIEPAIIITISVMVGVILLSVMAPLMGIMSSIGG